MPERARLWNTTALEPKAMEGNGNCYTRMQKHLLLLMIPYTRIAICPSSMSCFVVVASSVSLGKDAGVFGSGVSRIVRMSDHLKRTKERF